MNQQTSFQFQKTLFIFRRDLRIDDNTGLIAALSLSKIVIPAFIFSPEQIDKNPYKSDKALHFMLDALEDLSEDFKKRGANLFFFEGLHETVVSRCIQKLKIDAVMVNRDYTPYSIQRDQKIELLCKKKEIPFLFFDDALLHPPEATLKKDKTPYTIFTPFFQNASKLPVEKPMSTKGSHYFQGTIEFSLPRAIIKKLRPGTPPGILPGTRKEGLKILKSLKKHSHYSSLRDFLDKEGTTHLSPYLKFTLVSPREVFWTIHDTFSLHHPLIRSLYWRDFFSMIALFFPKVFGHPFQERYEHISWEKNKKSFHEWCEGKTGFPVVDAGMRELVQTGVMHNRARMIAASFLVKDLHIDWREGEKFFAQHLLDYDPAVNNGNWQWVASTGTDHQPYFRIFNPWLQQKKFDPECLYIKKWIPELKEVDPKLIHNWYKEAPLEGISYPKPTLEHSTAAKKAILLYQRSL